MAKIKVVFKGGPGSGHKGHKGIVGEQGGSLPRDGISNKPMETTKIYVSGKTVITRGWDGRQQRDPNDPEWNEIAGILENKTRIKAGKGFRYELTVTKKQAERIIEDLIDNGNYYMSERDQETRSMGRAMLSDGQRIREQIKNME